MGRQRMIGVSEQLKDKLKALKVYPRESFGDVIDKLIQEHGDWENTKIDGKTIKEIILEYQTKKIKEVPSPFKPEYHSLIENPEN